MKAENASLFCTWTFWKVSFLHLNFLELNWQNFSQLVHPHTGDWTRVAEFTFGQKINKNFKQARKARRCNSYLQIWNYQWLTHSLTVTDRGSCLENLGDGIASRKNPHTGDCTRVAEFTFGRKKPLRRTTGVEKNEKSPRNPCFTFDTPYSILHLSRSWVLFTTQG